MAFKQVYKSKNFDKYLNGKRLTDNGKKALFKNVSTVNTIARRDFVPVATGATQRSMRMQVQDAGKSIELSSNNYANTGGSGKSRYDYTKANGAYKIRGKEIPAGKNAGRYQWYDKAYKKQETQFIADMKGAIYD